MNRISVDGTRFIDDEGRERIFTGMNVCDKSHFGRGKVEYTPASQPFPFEQFKALGFDIIRLGFTWSAIEPFPRRYNDELLDNIGEFLDKCLEHGIYAYLDMHQDLYSHYCFGDGAPRWATLTDGIVPQKQKLVWAEGYFYGKACHRAFDNFWENKQVNGYGLQDYYADMWKHVAQRIGSHPAVFGFDVMNEPFPGKDGGTVFKKLIASLVGVTATDGKISRTEMVRQALGKEKPRALDQYDAETFAKICDSSAELIRKFDTERYSPFLNKTATAIREAVSDRIMFSENCYYSNLGIPCSNEPITVDGVREANQCFAPHGYDIMVDTPAYKYANNSRVGSIFDQHRITQQRLNVPVLVGEWGGNSEGTDWFPHVRFLLDKYDSYKWSNTYWCYVDGLLDMPLMSILSRPHPKAVAGDIISYNFDYDNSVFTLEYDKSSTVTAPTVIYLPKEPAEVSLNGSYTLTQLYGGGYDMTIDAPEGKSVITVRL